MITKIPFPFRIILNITNECNSNCIYCSNKEFVNKDLDIEDWRKVIKILSDKKIASVILSGGEPLVSPYIYDIIKLLSEYSIRVNLISNGILVREIPVDIMNRISAIQISYDGMKYNKQYRKISPEIPLEAMKRTHSQKIKTYSMTVVTRENLADMENIYLEVRDRTDLCCFERVSIIGNARQHLDLQLAKDDERQFLENIQYLQNKYGNTVFCNDPIQNCFSFQEESISGCAIGLSTLCISSNGDILPCTRLPIILGNILNDNIEEIWNNSEMLNEIRLRNLKGKCQICQHKIICGGCRAAAWAKSGDYLGEDPECFLE